MGIDGTVLDSDGRGRHGPDNVAVKVDNIMPWNTPTMNRGMSRARYASVPHGTIPFHPLISRALAVIGPSAVEKVKARPPRYLSMSAII